MIFTFIMPHRNAETIYAPGFEEIRVSVSRR